MHIFYDSQTESCEYYSTLTSSAAKSQYNHHIFYDPLTNVSHSSYPKLNQQS